MSAPLWYRYTFSAPIVLVRHSKSVALLSAAERLHHTIFATMPFGRNSFVHCQCKHHALPCVSDTSTMADDLSMNFFPCQGFKALS